MRRPARDRRLTAFLESIDPLVVLAVVTPLILAIGAWSLRMACSICAVEPPTFWHALLTLLILLIANVVLRFFLHVTQTPATLGTQYVAPVVTNAVVIAVSLPSGPIAAIIIAIVHAIMTAVIYVGAMVAAGMLPI